MASTPLPVRVREVEFFERPVPLRMPFRFGVTTLRDCRQVFVRAVVEVNGRAASGVASESLVPKWFDKRPGYDEAANIAHLRGTLGQAAALYQMSGHARSAFALHRATWPEQLRCCRAADVPDLTAGFGAALLDRAVADAVCRAAGVDFFSAVNANLPGLDASLTPDLAGFDLDAFLAALRPLPSVHVRHTVGMVDALGDDADTDLPEPTDNLPRTLRAAIGHYGLTHFKLKLSGNIEADLARLGRIATVLEDVPSDLRVSLDGNEQFPDVAPLADLWERMARQPALRRLRAAIVFVEQPISRAAALTAPLGEFGRSRPVEIDESDDGYDVFPRARALGYRGISSKACKGIYRSLLNRARCAMWNAREGREHFFMTGEDLMTLAGVSVQQDLMLASLIGCAHIERNGHHYTDGLAHAPATEQLRFLTQHPQLYRRDGGTVRLHIAEGRLDLRDLRQPGLASGAEPDWSDAERMDYRALAFDANAASGP